MHARSTILKFMFRPSSFVNDAALAFTMSQFYQNLCRSPCLGLFPAYAFYHAFASAFAFTLALAFALAFASLLPLVNRFKFQKLVLFELSYKNEHKRHPIFYQFSFS